MGFLDLHHLSSVIKPMMEPFEKAQEEMGEKIDSMLAELQKTNELLAELLDVVKGL